MDTVGEVNNMDFSEAIDKVINNGKGMRLPKWNDDVVIRCKLPGFGSDMTAPYLYVRSFRDGEERRVPWKETFPEIFSNEWIIID